jgi:exopolysaccharide biosynthesis polyprenyl glycosylphosphotransferase
MGGRLEERSSSIELDEERSSIEIARGEVARLRPQREREPGRREAPPRSEAGRSRAEERSAIGEIAGPLASMRRDALFRRMLLLADLFALTSAFVLTVQLPWRSMQLTLLGLAGVPFLVLGSKMLGLYDRDEMLLRKTTLDEAPKLFQLATLCALVAWLAGGMVVSGGLGRRESVFLWLSLAVMLMISRAAARGIALRIAPAERCLFIGDAASAKVLVPKLCDHSGVKAEMVAQVDLDELAPWSAGAFSKQRLAEIGSMARSLDVHRVIVAPHSDEGAETLDLVRALKSVGVKVSVLPRLLEVVGSSVEFDDLHGITVMGVRRFALGRSSRAVKRIFDLLGSLAMLIAVGPLMIAIAIAIKLDSRGPVFFRQLRVGRRGERFHMFKFRTMVANAEELKESLRHRNEAQDGLFKIADDPRITRVGRLLRSSALDELPQLFNIVRGEMSLVGPRPLVVDEDSMIEGWQRQRLELMPGMTGPWQILGPTRVPLAEMAAIDYLYIANWSLWADVKIMLRTVPHVLSRKGL